jgi:hypothetical protein
MKYSMEGFRGRTPLLIIFGIEAGLEYSLMINGYNIESSFI